MNLEIYFKPLLKSERVFSMGFINVFVSSDAHISTHNSQLVLKGKGEISYPISDINSIMIESRRATISSHSITELSANNVVVFMCDASHIPSTIILPFCQYFSQLGVYKTQKETPKPLEKRLWQSIVKCKIKNQSTILQFAGSEKESTLVSLSDKVVSGDSTNQEAVASAIYFPALFGKGFTRGSENIINACLNYGYAIIRGIVARSVVSHGLMPFLGINHCSQLNNFNLADDLIEVFRPIVDLFVLTNFGQIKECTELNTQLKLEIYNLVNCDVWIDGCRQTVAYAIDLFVSSFVKSIKEGENFLKFPQIIPLQQHRYE